MLRDNSPEALSRRRSSSDSRLVGSLLQAFAVTVLAIFLYAGLRSELPVDDILRFPAHIAEGIYDWDAAHLFMQPAALLWHRYLGFGAPARTSQERFNAFCAASRCNTLPGLA